jgi:cytochrome c oxidase assembly protein subunit 11
VTTLKLKGLNKNTRLLLWLVLAFFVSLGMAYAAVPLYRAFCQATGIDGRGKRVEAASVVNSKLALREVRVHFDTNINGINWSFKVAEPTINTRIGKTTLAHFTVKNLSDKPITGRAVYNILPDTMGPYFLKIECFCFTDQTLKAGEEKTFPVVYFLDPKLMDNVDTKNINDVTLSYTFFESKGANP